MRRWALVVEGVVRQVDEVDPLDRYPPSYFFVPCDKKVSYDWTYEDGDFRPPPRIEK